MLHSSDTGGIGNRSIERTTVVDVILVGEWVHRVHTRGNHSDSIISWCRFVVGVRTIEWVGSLSQTGIVQVLKQSGRRLSCGQNRLATRQRSAPTETQWQTGQKVRQVVGIILGIAARNWLLLLWLLAMRRLGVKLLFYQPSLKIH